MSPLAHGLLAWLIAIMILKKTKDRRLAIICGGFSDIDGFYILYDRELYLTYHHTFGHSFVLAVPVILAATYLATDKQRTLLASVAAFIVHLAADIFGSNWPVQPLFPLTDYMVPLSPLFSDFIIYNVINPVTLIIAMILTFTIMYKIEKSPFEFFSKKLNKRFISIFVYPLKYKCEVCKKRPFFQCDICNKKICQDHVTGDGLLTQQCHDCAGQ